MSIYNEIGDERDRQDRKWGGPQHDDQHSHYDFCNFIIERLVGDKFTHHPRKTLVQVAALAVAAVESLDRQSDRHA